MMMPFAWPLFHSKQISELTTRDEAELASLETHEIFRGLDNLLNGRMRIKVCAAALSAHYVVMDVDTHHRRTLTGSASLGIRRALSAASG